MRVLITGICGFVGSTLADAIIERGLPYTLIGFDNLVRRGSEKNLERLKHRNIECIHGDLRCQSDVDSIPEFDWVVDAAANASVLAGTAGHSSSRQLLEHNLVGTIHLLERCRALRAGLILLSTSRVYSITSLANIPLRVHDRAFRLDNSSSLPSGLSSAGIQESFSTSAPISLYGASKLASETLALEYGDAFGFPVWINRCGLMAGAGQFGQADQGIISYWIRRYRQKMPLKYLGFDGTGHQVRDCLHPRDLVSLLEMQLSESQGSSKPRRINVSGGIDSTISLRQLSDWCKNRFGEHRIETSNEQRPFDLPWVVLDASLAKSTWDWSPQTSLSSVLNEIADSQSSY